MLKALFLTHRYLGIFLGLVMVLWCLSGFIMMYKSYPELSDQERRELLPTLQLAECCQVPASESLGESQYENFHLQMLGTMPVLHLNTLDGRLVTVDLKYDRVFHSIPDSFAEYLSAGFAADRQYPTSQLLGVINNDQWTVYGAYNPHRPLYHMAAEDEIGTQWYLSSRTGEIIQLTTRSERIWGYLGAVIHWLYPTILREKVRLWSQVVLWLTVASIFLTASGLYFGFRQLRNRRNGRISPYLGLSRWHHFAGLFFGLFTFTWVLSGLFSIQPWGLMEGEGPQQENRLLQGGALEWQQINALLPRLPQLQLPAGTVQLQGKVLKGELALFATGSSGILQRYAGDSLKPAPLNSKTLFSLASMLSPAGEPIAAELITEEDAYYYNHHDSVQLPAYRVIVNDGWDTRYYLDPASGEIHSRFDGEDKLYRWLHYGIHRGDFTRFLRSRPIWDLFMGILMFGVTLGAITGMFIGFRRLARGL
jgi:hypothetical protein